MDFSSTKQQLILKQQVIDFARSELNDDLFKRDKESLFSRENWNKCASFGLQGLITEKQYGGSEHDVLTAVLMMEAFGYGCRDNGLGLGLNGQIWAVQQPIQIFGSEAQKQRYLPGLCNGSLIGLQGITETQAGSDAHSMQTMATPCEGGYRLNGSKAFIGMGPVADIAIIFAQTDTAKGKWGITSFLVDCHSPGFIAKPASDKMGMRTVPLGDLVLENCFVPEDNRLGPEGGGITVFNSTLEWERSFTLTSHVGAMQYQLEKAVNYANERQQFNQSIGKFQSISNRIADMRLRLETAKLLLYKAAWMKEQGTPNPLEAALVKLYVSECSVESSLAAVRLYGARGYMSEFEVERDLRDTLGGLIYSGTSDIQRLTIARLTGLR